jgi:hypothetical protein
VFYVVMRRVSDWLPKPPPKRPDVPTTGGAPATVELEPER